jgi:PAS domain S-box-containing protein
VDSIIESKVFHYTPIEVLLSQADKLPFCTREHLIALANSVPHLGWMTDPHGEFLWFNQQWHDYTGLTTEQSLNDGWQCAHYPENLSKILNVWNLAIATRMTYEATYQLRRYDGVYRWFLTRAIPTYDESGAVTSWVGTCTDIEEATQTQQEIATILDNVEEGFVSIDKNWTVTQLNTYHLLRMGNVQKHTQMGKNFLDLYFGDDEARETLFYSKFLHAMKERIALKFEAYYTPAEIWSAVNVYPKSDGGLAIFYRDITSEKKAQTELIRAKENSERASQLKTAFLANMSHEIRTPLASVMGFAEVLKEKNLTEKDKDRFLNMIIRNGASLSRIIDDILDLSKVEAGHLEVEDAEMAFDHLLHEVLALFREKVKGKNIYLKLNLSSDVPTRIKSDATRVRQILINLIGNAIKFTKDGGVDVDIHSEKFGASKSRFQVTIRDTGIGLSTDQAEKLFRPFTQADNSTTRKYGGTGLGLALSKRLAQALGGDIRILHTQPGVGSTFAFDFIADTTFENNSCQIPENSYQQTHLDLKNIRVLLAEDSPDSQELIKHILINHGARVTVANDGAEALETAQNQEFDVILMDIQMPELDGYEVTRRLRKDNLRIPIIALTAHAMLEERQRTKAAGCDAHVTKPLNFRHLLSTVYSITQDSAKRHLH